MALRRCSSLSITLPALLKVDMVKILFSALPMEDKPLDMISVEDVGQCVMNIFYRPKQFSRKIMSLAGDRLTMEDVARVFNKNICNKKFIHPKVRLTRIMAVNLLLLFYGGGGVIVIVVISVCSVQIGWVFGKMRNLCTMTV